jgi:hypothetical protein
MENYGGKTALTFRTATLGSLTMPEILQQQPEQPEQPEQPQQPQQQHNNLAQSSVGNQQRTGRNSK